MPDAPPREDWRKKLVKLFARCSQPACIRYPVDGADEIDRVIDAAIEARFGPDIAYSEWLLKLRRNGLVP